MKTIFFLLLFSLNLYAQVCEDEAVVGNLADFAGKSCLLDGVKVTQLPNTLKFPKGAKEYCTKCNDPVLNKILNSPDARLERSKLLGKTVFDEFQKGLTFLSIDLMRIRSSYKLDFDPSLAVDKCDTKKNLKKPKCLKDRDLVDWDRKVNDIQNALATELSIQIKGDSPSKQGLLTRKAKSCEISDSEAIYSHTRYTESLLTPDFITKLKSLNVPKETSLLDSLAENTDASFVDAAIQLNMHPLFKNLLNNKEQLSIFLKTISPQDNQDSIIMKLYSPSQIKNLSSNIEERCDNLFQKTNSYLEKMYCSTNPSFVADDLNSLEAISGSKLNRLPANKVDEELKTFCSYLNTSEKGQLSFSEVNKNINGSNDKVISKAPLNEFKQEAFNQMYLAPSELICNSLRSSSCSETSPEINCKLLHFYNLSKKSPQYSEMAKSSSDNVNLILRSLVGDGLPQVDGKPSTQDIALLKAEGILPGGDASTRTSQPTVASFQKTMSSAATTAAPQAAKPTSVAPTPGKTDSDSQQPNYMSSAATRTEESEDDDSSSQATRTQTPKSKASTKTNNKFSNLSDDEQQRIMDMMKRSKKAGGKTPSASDSEEDIADADSVNAIGNSMAGLASQAATTGSAVAGIASAASQAASSAKKAVLDPTKKSNSLNEAMVDANAARSIASVGSASATPSGAQVSVSKSAANENEIKIKVAESELNQVNEFKEKLKVLLNAHSQEISVAGAGEKFVVKLNNFEINVVFNKKLNTYEAVCKDASIPADYLKTISNYFNVTLKNGSGKRESLIKTLKQG